ncbi:hypothetical protein MLD38_016983 [Melastoma candidum]|uniref:Uncharacterized protein n=1 Tax=Melastoma candidum TaxID=119954 RepID=A0ACB9QR13_9MYRT|nr:hypothetical protein MLD38_016983 [Melastoma candidum]
MTTLAMGALQWPFGDLKCLDAQEIRETAYEVFVAACRTLPSFTARNKKNVVQGNNGLVHSRVKKSLGLKASNKSPLVKETANGKRTVRSTSPFTLAELMRQQMGVTDRENERLLHMLTKTLAGQAGRRVEAVILPLELIRNVMPSEFKDAKDYHAWQRRHLKILEVGLLLHPLIPLDKSNGFALRLGDAIQASEAKPINTGNNSDVMGSLTNAVITLSWRSIDGTPSDTCHWADGYPLNIHLYLALLTSIFDIEEETMVLDEVDDLLELMKKTWYILGINRHVHNVCLSWVFFQRYVATNQTEPDLLAAAQSVLDKVAKDPKRPDNDPIFAKAFSAALSSMRSWLEERLLNYHECFNKETVSMMESMLPLALTVLKASGDNRAPASEPEEQDKIETAAYVDLFISSSLEKAFAKAAEDHQEDSGEALITTADKIESLAEKEVEIFSPVLGKWNQAAAGLALVTLHGHYGVLLKQYLSDATTLNEEIARVLKRAQVLEKNLVKMATDEHPADGVDDGAGKASVAGEMVSYETEAFTTRLVNDWIDRKLEEAKSLLDQAKETETWNPKSKSEAIAESSVELVELAEGAVNEFKTIQVGGGENLNGRLIHGLSNLFKDYISFVASCGSKRDFIPPLPILTRRHQDSKLAILARKAACGANLHSIHDYNVIEGETQGLSMGRGTQRLYIRLNTLQYLLTCLQALRLDSACSSIKEEFKHMSEVAAYRLIFRDSGYVLYDTLYSGNVSNTQFKTTLEVLKRNLSLLRETLDENAQELAIEYTMRASFDAYLRVLIAGGNTRVFHQTDHKVIEDNFESLKQEFSSLPEGTVAKEAEVVEEVIKLMGQSSEQLIEGLSSAMNVTAAAAEQGKKLAIPGVPERWSASDPNTILRVLCHRNDRTATMYLKKTFQLEKRR